MNKKIFLAGMDNSHTGWYELMIHNKVPKYYGLYSYYYLTKNPRFNFKRHSNHFNEVLIDSGAHTFHTAKNLNFKEFTYKYADWITKNDKPNITGFFELDIDNRIGYKNVLTLRKILEQNTDKIIPVWHKNRGNNNFIEMCKNYDYVSISCLPIEGITDENLHLYEKTAHRYNCRIHGLGGTRQYILDNVNFDSVDSISWLAPVSYNKLQLKTNNYRQNYSKLVLHSYLKGCKQQIKYDKTLEEKKI